MQEQTGRLVGEAEAYCREQTGIGITPIPSSQIRKESLARDRQEERGVTEGLIGIWSATESCMTYKARFSKKCGFPQMGREWGECKHLYYYFDDPDYGFMNIRLQTWFPYHIQIAMNGREWLRRDLEKSGIGFERHRNKILSLEDYDAAQKLLNRQLDTRWPEVLGGTLPIVFPSMGDIVGSDLKPYWTLWQSEWATDHIFRSQAELRPLGEMLIMQAFLTGTTPQVLRYFDRPMTKSGRPYANMSHEVISRIMELEDGLRVRHWVGSNSVKAYIEQNVFRTETTLNNPGMFRVHRHAQSEATENPKRYLPMRKGVADIPLRAQISGEINKRFNESLAQMESNTSLSELIEPVCQRGRKKQRCVRPLDVLGKDRSLLCALADPKHAVSGITNRDLRNALGDTAGFGGKTQNQQSSKASRLIRLLRDHGLLHKYPRQNRYRLSPKGAKLTTVLCAALHASTQELTKIAA